MAMKAPLRTWRAAVVMLAVSCSTAILSGCVGPLVDHVRIDPDAPVPAIPVLAADQLVGKRFAVLQPLVATSCRNKLTDDAPTRENAIAQMQVKASALAASAITNLYCEAPQGTNLVTNCWSSLTCHGTAIRIEN
jgi:uncharacterized protein YbjQ (UPF0145 family)